MKEYWYIDKRTGELVCSNQLINDPKYEFMFEIETNGSSLEEDDVFSYNIKRINMAKLVVDILDRRHRATFGQLCSELSRYTDRAKGNVKSRLHKILSMLEAKGVVFRFGGYYYRLNLGEFIKRRHGETMDKKKLAIILGIPFGGIERLINFAVSRGWLKTTSNIETYQLPTCVWKITKEKSWKKRPEASLEGRITAVVYSTSPDFWPEDKLENTITKFLARKSMRSFRIISEIMREVSSLNHEIAQSFNRSEVKVSMLPEGLGLDEVDLKIWKPEEEGRTYFIHYVKKVWGWKFIEWKTLPED